MKRLLSRFLSALVLLGIHTALSAAERVALVIGNDAYKHARKLNAALNDATAVAGALQKLGFETLVASNAGLEHMVEAMETLRVKAVGAQAVLVYYAGHGIESQGQNFLIPVDAQLEKEIQLQTQTVNLNGVLDKLTALNVPARMVILDCCRDNPLEGRTWLATRSAGGGGLGELAVQSLPAATLVVYAASPGKPALDRLTPSDEHSPFTQALLDALPQPGVHSFEVFGRVEESVLERTQGRQSPRLFYNGSTLPFRNFTFAKAGSGAPPGVENVSFPPPTVEAPSAPPMAPDPAASIADQPPAIALNLPARGYFNLDELFADSPYASYNSYSKGHILKKAQEKLKTLGHYPGKPDGVPGPGTQRAILEWQQANEKKVSGKFDLTSLESLRLENLTPMRIPASDTLPPGPNANSSSQKPPNARQLTPEERVRRAVGL